MPINAGHEYFEAEKRYLAAQTNDEKIERLEELIKTAPKHKGSENLLAELKTRLRKLREKAEKGKKVGKGKKGIRKEGYQVALVGLTNAGKSALLAKLTNASPLISEHRFSTIGPELGTMDYDGVRAQVVDLPAVGNKNFDIGIVNNADCLLLVIESLDDLLEIEKPIYRASGKRIVVVNKVERLSQDEFRKLEARCKSKRLNYVLVSSFTGQGLDELKKKIFESMGVIRIYMKEPGKVASRIPLVLKEGGTVREVAESILKGFSSRVRETKVTGPSAKFLNQKVGLSHVLKDRDVVEFKT